MTSTLKKALIATLTAATMSMGATTAHAVGGTNALAGFESGKTIEQVQRRGRGFRGRGFRGGRSFRGRGFRGGRSFRGSRFRSGRSFRGRGFRNRGFRGRNLGIGFAKGFLIGSVLYSQRKHHSNSALRNHVAWCTNKYKSYNVKTDTFISFKHGKKRCNSPHI